MQPGDRIDRFILLGELGSGGMSVVHAAWDPELDRRIALKLMRPGDGGGPATSMSRQRLVREAQALAKVAHENVIVVYDVGTAGDQVFIAEELVDGWTLRAWIDERPRDWREVVAVLAQAGRGLAGAHAAGLVHRDFKPENVLVSRDGRVRVTDFGLARTPFEIERDAAALPAATSARADHTPLPSAREATEGSGPGAAATPRDIDALAATAVGSPSSGSLTEEGAIIGTPRYMSPEQLHGRSADARSDQFSFCAVLYEALWRRRPFAGETVTDLRIAVDRDRPIPPPSDPRVPAWLRRAILRGLRRRPEDRHPSMDALLAELRRDRSGARRLALIGGLAIALAALALWPRGGANTPPCAGAERGMDGVWDDPVRARVREAFLATGKPFAADAWRSLEQALDLRRDRWVAGHIDACEAASVRREQSPAALDLRMSCLARRRSELVAFVRVLSDADAAVVERAVTAAGELPAIEQCADLDRLMARIPPPADAATAARVQGVRAQLDRVRALDETAQHRAARAIVDPSLAEARALGYPPLVAEAEYWAGRTATETRDLDRAHDLLLAAFEHALAAGHDPIAAEAAGEHLYLLTQILLRPGETAVFIPVVRAMRQRIAGDVDIEQQLTLYLAHAHYERGEIDMARTEADRGLALSLRLDGPEGIHTARALNVLANVQGDTGRIDEALANYRRSIAIVRRKLGHEHPEVAVATYNLGLVLRYRGDHDAALEHIRTARAMFEKAGDPVMAAYCAHNEARTLQAKGELHAALAGFRAVLAAGEKLVGADNADLAYPLTGIGAVLRRQGKLAEAEPPLRRALALRERWFPGDNPILAETLAELGLLELARGRTAAARPLLDRALAACDRRQCKEVDLAAVRAARDQLLAGR